MNIVLMRNNSDLNVLGKDLSTLKTVQGNFKAKTDIVNPVLTINGIDDIISIFYSLLYYINEILKFSNISFINFMVLIVHRQFCLQLIIAANLLL